MADDDVWLVQAGTEDLPVETGSCRAAKARIWRRRSFSSDIVIVMDLHELLEWLKLDGSIVQFIRMLACTLCAAKVDGVGAVNNRAPQPQQPTVHAYTDGL